MANLIDEEYRCSQQYRITPDPKCEDRAALTRDNIARVEAIIRIDSSYIRSSDKEAEPLYKRDGSYEYQGSTAYWMSKMKQIIEKQDCQYTFAEVLANSVESIDRENSTHLNADGVGRAEITARLQALSEQQLVSMLQDTDNYPLVRLLTEATQPEDTAKYHARFNLSFATKYCHYACFYLFEGTEKQDLYSIYDKIVATALPDYLPGKGKKREFRTHQDMAIDDYIALYHRYQDAIGGIIASLPAPISRNGFDHLLWYYHKGQ